MLSGMESFLKTVSTATLKNHLSEMNLSSAGNQDQLVDRLLVKIFDLEDQSAIAKETTTADKKNSAAEKTKSKKQSNGTKSSKKRIKIIKK